MSAETTDASRRDGSEPEGSGDHSGAGEREWGVRFPSGAVESMGSDEERARKFALATGNLRPDLPTLVVRRIVTDWEVTS